MEQKDSLSNAAPPQRELGSWKEIADYLGVNIRTAQKWERERALPVRRGSGPRSRVSASAEALDAWRQKTTTSASQADHCYRWPLGPGLTVEVRFQGAELDQSHIELLREYLDLFKTALR